MSMEDYFAMRAGRGGPAPDDPLFPAYRTARRIAELKAELAEVRAQLAEARAGPAGAGGMDAGTPGEGGAPPAQKAGADSNAARVRWYGAAEMRFRRHYEAVELCQAIAEKHEHTARLIIENCKRPEVFVEICHWGEFEAVQCPLDLAAERSPKHALAMLAAGADPCSASMGGASFLYSTVFGGREGWEDPIEESPLRLELFGKLMEGGADPALPVVWDEDGVEAPYNHSLLAYLISREAVPFIARLRELPGYDGIIWPIPAGPPVSAADFALATGKTELAVMLRAR